MTGFGEPWWLWALLGAPACVVATWWSARRRRRELATFADPALHGVLGVERSSRSSLVSAAALAIAVALMAAALARPRGNPRLVEGTASGRDVVFLVDVSRSMLATDLSPTRLDRAKLWIKDVAASLRGDRVALVAFAGTSVVKCPLTLDYPFFSLALDDLSPRSVSRGGTLIGDAIRRSLDDVFEWDEERPRDIILITDGEDQESFPVEAAQQAGAKGVRVIALGLGDAGTGALVPAEDSAPLTYRGERVLSKQDTGTLARVASASAGGVYFNVGTGTIELDRVYRDLVQGGETREIKAETATVYREYFQPLLGVAAALLAIEPFASVQRRRRSA